MTSSGSDGPDELEFLRAVVESELCIVVRWLPDSTISWVSPSLEKHAGLDNDRITQLRVDDFVPPECVEMVARRVGQLTPEHPNYISESVVNLPDGTSPWVRRETRAFFRGDELIALQTVGVDVSETREALGEALASEARLMSILEHLEDAILLLDARGNLAWACPSVQRAFGPDVKLIAQRSEGVLADDDHTALTNAFDEVLAEGPMAQRRVQITLQVGQSPERRLEMLQVNMLDVRGVNAIVVHVRDVTARERAATVDFETDLRQLLTDVREFVLHLDPTGVVRYASPSFEDHVSRSVVGTPFEDALPGSDPATLRSLKEEIHSSPGRRVIARVPFSPHGDEPRWIELVARELVEPGKLAGVVVVGRILDGSTDAHLAVVANSGENDESNGTRSDVDPGAVDLVERFRNLSASQKVAVIAALRSSTSTT